jgi:hypothetical protein
MNVFITNFVMSLMHTSYSSYSFTSGVSNHTTILIVAGYFWSDVLWEID